MYWNAEVVGRGKDGNGVCRCHLTAAAAPANTVLVRHRCGQHTTAWQRVRAEAASLPKDPAPPPHGSRYRSVYSPQLQHNGLGATGNEEAVWQVHKPGSSHLPHTPTMVVVTCIETEVTWTGETHYPRHPGVNFHLKRDIPHHENKRKTSNY